MTITCFVWLALICRNAFLIRQGFLTEVSSAYLGREALVGRNAFLIRQGFLTFYANKENVVDVISVVMPS